MYNWGSNLDMHAHHKKGLYIYIYRYCRLIHGLFSPQVIPLQHWNSHQKGTHLTRTHQPCHCAMVVNSVFTFRTTRNMKYTNPLTKIFWPFNPFSVWLFSDWWVPDFKLNIQCDLDDGWLRALPIQPYVSGAPVNKL